MASSFSDAEWNKIRQRLDVDGEAFGLPERREHSLVFGSFNIRKLGARDSKSSGAWSMIREICRRFDLLSIQEVQDNLEGLRALHQELGEDEFGIVASDITGSYPGEAAPERLAFLYRRATVRRTEIASDITFDRTRVVDTLYQSRLKFWKSFDDYTEKIAAWRLEAEERKSQNRKPRRKPALRVPEFLTFTRQPLCASFRIPSPSGGDPYEFLAVNAHLLFGRYKAERWMEFEALISWLVDRARQVERIAYPNLMLLGDLNLDFKAVDPRREEIETLLKSLNQDHLEDVRAEINFPFLDVHPDEEAVFRTNARLSQTYDQIALVVHDRRLPSSKANRRAGRDGPDGFDYGVFHFVELFSAALFEKPFAELTEADSKAMIREFEHDFTDHMPIWIRLPNPR